jgi:hypothetical protein
VTNNQLTDRRISELLESATEYDLTAFAKNDDLALALRELQERRKAAMDSEPVQMFGIGSIFKPQRVIEQEADCDDCAHYNPKICHGEGCPAISQQSAQPAPVVPDENVSFHRLPGESEYDRLNRQREWMESKSKLAKVTAAAPDDLTERLLRLRAQATLDGSYLDTEEWDSLACDVIKALNACRAAMLAAAPQEVQGE